MKPYFNGPKQPESHYATLLNIFMYMYVSYCMLFQHFVNYLMSFSSSSLIWPFIKYLHLI